jgi:hypothetical protein
MVLENIEHMDKNCARILYETLHGLWLFEYYVWCVGSFNALQSQCHGMQEMPPFISGATVLWVCKHYIGY